MVNGDGQSECWRRGQKIDQAVDDYSVAAAMSDGVVSAMVAVQLRCQAMGVPDVTLAEVIRSWAVTIR